MITVITSDKMEEQELIDTLCKMVNDKDEKIKKLNKTIESFRETINEKNRQIDNLERILLL